MSKPRNIGHLIGYRARLLAPVLSNEIDVFTFADKDAWMWDKFEKADFSNTTWSFLHEDEDHGSRRLRDVPSLSIIQGLRL